MRKHKIAQQTYKTEQEWVNDVKAMEIGSEGMKGDGELTEQC